MSNTTLGKVNINMLNMIYDKVYDMGNSIYYCTVDNVTALVDEYGNDIKLYDSDSTEIKLTYIKKYEEAEDIVILNGETYGVPIKVVFNTRERRYITAKDDCKITKVIDNIVAILESAKRYYNYNVRLLNNKFEIIAEFKDIEYIGGFEEYKSNIPNITYLYYSLGGSRYKFTIDKSTNRVISYDNYKLKGNDLRAVATSIKDKKEGVLRISQETYEGFMYRLSNKGILLGKEYDEIRKPEQLDNTNLMYVYNKEYIGVINETNGEELISPEYENLEYIGFNNFIATNKDDKANILNAYSGNMYADEEVKEIKTHTTLPMITIRFKDNTLKFYNILNGIVFNIEDFAKQFKCEYNSERPDILRVSLTWGFKYITNTLVPITNLGYIKQLNNSSWVKM